MGVAGRAEDMLPTYFENRNLPNCKKNKQVVINDVFGEISAWKTFLALRFVFCFVKND